MQPIHYGVLLGDIVLLQLRLQRQRQQLFNPLLVRMHLLSTKQVPCCTRLPDLRLLNIHAAPQPKTCRYGTCSVSTDPSQVDSVYNQAATFYSDCNNGGSSNSQGVGAYPNSGYLPCNDCVSALTIPTTGMAVQLFKDSNYGSSNMCFTYAGGPEGPGQWTCINDVFKDEATSLKASARPHYLNWVGLRHSAKYSKGAWTEGSCAALRMPQPDKCSHSLRMTTAPSEWHTLPKPLAQSVRSYRYRTQVYGAKSSCSPITPNAAAGCGDSCQCTDGGSNTGSGNSCGSVPPPQGPYLQFCEDSSCSVTSEWQLTCLNCAGATVSLNICNKSGGCSALNNIYFCYQDSGGTMVPCLNCGPCPPS